MLKAFILIVQINNTTPDAFAAYEYQGDCEEIAFILDEAMPNGSAWCEEETKWTFQSFNNIWQGMDLPLRR